MENNEGIKDNNSDSENSEWAVIDEDASLEWNDEAKYHFRSTNHKSDTKETSLTRVQSPAFSGNTSDEDSIEVVSDIANDDHITDDVGNFESHDDEEENTAGEVKSPDIPLHGANEMVWYRLGERKAIAEDHDNAILDRANNKKQNVLNLSDNWDLVAILIVALIGGFAVGYFCGNSGSHRDEVVPSRLLVNKLQCAVSNMRWHQSRLRRASAGLRVPPTCGITPKLLNSTTLSLPVRPLDSIESEPKLEGDGSTPAKKASNTQVKPDAFLEREVSDEVEEGTKWFPDDSVANIDLPLLAEIDQIVQQVQVEEYAEEDVVVGIAPEVISSDPLREAIEKIFHLVVTNEKFPNFAGFTSNLEFLKRINFSLEVLDSVLKSVPLKDTNKVMNYRQDVEKSSKKLLRRIDKAVTRFVKHLNNKLEESKSSMLKKLCKHWSVSDNENRFASIELANTVFEECGHTKQSRKGAGREANVSTPNAKHISKPSTHKVAHEPLVCDEAVKPTVDVKQRTKEAHEAAKPTVDRKQHKKGGDKIRSKRDSTAKTMPTKEKQCTRKKADCNHEPSEVKQNTASENQHHTGNRDKKIARKETSLPRKSVEEDKQARGTKTSEDLVSDDYNNEYDMGHLYHPAKVSSKGSESETDPHSDAPKATDKADSVLASDNGTSTVSGEWVLRMGNSRAKQRHNDHQSDWLFDRAQSRKCHRGNKDCKTSLYTKHIPSEFKYSSGAGGDTRKERKHWLKNAIPKRIVEAAKTAKNAFNEFRHNMKQRVRFE